MRISLFVTCWHSSSAFHLGCSVLRLDARASCVHPRQNKQLAHHNSYNFMFLVGDEELAEYAFFAILKNAET